MPAVMTAWTLDFNFFDTLSIEFNCATQTSNLQNCEVTNEQMGVIQQFKKISEVTPPPFKGLWKSLCVLQASRHKKKVFYIKVNGADAAGAHPQLLGHPT
jgi:hypothetical protein